jgi:hypothetical protein
MKYLITERQLHLLTEQDDWWKKSSYDKGVWNKSTKTLDNMGKLDPHTIATIFQIGTAFIPFVGPFISAGIGLADAYQYYTEGDKKTAGMVGLFSIIPGIGGLASKLGLSKWGAKALGEIGKKLSLGGKLTPLEVQVANKVAQNRQLIQNEIVKLGNNASIKGAVKTVRTNATKKAVTKSAKNVGKFVGTKVAPFVGAGVAYDLGYDALTGTKNSPNQQELSQIDTKKISPENLKASKELKF